MMERDNCETNECPKRHQTRKITSPTSCLQEDVLRELEVEIRAANELLLSLALSTQKEAIESFRPIFNGLFGQVVSIKIDCIAPPTEGKEQARQILTGKITLAGKNFVALDMDGEMLLTPYEKICEVLPKGKFVDANSEPRLINADACLKKCLVSDFGKVVSGSPQLIQTFFGIELQAYLLQFMQCEIKLKLDDETVEGDLVKVEKEILRVFVDDNKRTISIGDICYIVVCKINK